jgi:hypothetical protein
MQKIIHSVWNTLYEKMNASHALNSAQQFIAVQNLSKSYTLLHQFWDADCRMCKNFLSFFVF